jgi:hypothetical protein
MHTKLMSVLFCAGLLFVGAGCNSPEKEVSSKTVVVQENQPEEISSNTSNPTNNEIELSARAIGNNAVNFEWKVGNTAAESSEGWRILYGTEPNPTYPSTWWFERSKPHRQKLWSGLPAGHAYFRLCQVIGDACMIYSNNVEVDIPGEGFATSTTEQINETEEHIDAEVQEEITE